MKIKMLDLTKDGYSKRVSVTFRKPSKKEFTSWGLQKITVTGDYFEGTPDCVSPITYKEFNRSIHRAIHDHFDVVGGSTAIFLDVLVYDFLKQKGLILSEKEYLRKETLPEGEEVTGE